MKAKLEGTNSILNEGYGLSEASPVAISCPIFDLRDKTGSIGVPYPGTHAAVVDIETGTKSLQVGEVGELVISGPQVMKGYWNIKYYDITKTIKGLTVCWLQTL